MSLQKTKLFLIFDQAMPQKKKSCGKNYTRFYSEEDHLNDLVEMNVASLDVAPSEDVTTLIHSAYLGPVELQCRKINEDQYELSSSVNGIIVKTIDAQAQRLNPKKQDYNLRQLSRQPSAIVSKSRCKANMDIITSMRGDTKSVTTPDDEKKLANAFLENSAVDAHFSAVLFLKFIKKMFNMDNIIPNNVLISLWNVPSYDNAFFEGKYMVYGAGKFDFYSMTTLDTCGHELGHALNSKFKHLLYQAHSGALDEGYADIHGKVLEDFAYQSYPYLHGATDWLQGEDNGRRVKILRNMEDPFQSMPPQPKVYKGQFYADPNDLSNDSGGVHQNCSLPNYCFYLECTRKLYAKTALPETYMQFIQAYKSLPTLATFIQWRDALKAVLPDVRSLNEIGLTPEATNDWKVGFPHSIQTIFTAAPVVQAPSAQEPISQTPAEDPVEQVSDVELPHTRNEEQGQEEDEQEGDSEDSETEDTNLNTFDNVFGMGYSTIVAPPPILFENVKTKMGDRVISSTRPLSCPYPACPSHTSNIVQDSNITSSGDLQQNKDQEESEKRSELYDLNFKYGLYSDGKDDTTQRDVSLSEMNRVSNSPLVASSVEDNIDPVVNQEQQVDQQPQVDLEADLTEAEHPVICYLVSPKVEEEDPKCEQPVAE